jgi:PhnB protein
MPRVSTYLNFPGQTEEAFAFYRSVFGTEYASPITRYGEGPACPDHPHLSEAEKNFILHIELPILGGHVLMGTDTPPSMGCTHLAGNNVHINLEPDTRVEADRLFNALSEGGKVGLPMQEMFWGAYFGSFSDRFGIHWMINCTAAA